MDILKPFGKRDVLLYYSVIAKKLQRFLKGKEIATKTWILTFFIIKRGSKEEPLYIKEFNCVTKRLLELRSKNTLEKSRAYITKEQEKIWKYFPPKKLIDFFYATNREGKGKIIDRIFFDIDRGKGIDAEQAQKVALNLIKTIEKDKKFKKLCKFKFLVFWTGNSFHVYLMLKKLKPHSFYEKYISYNKSRPLESFTGRWAQQINKELKIKARVIAGHEKLKNTINIDPSQTPSGKLARCPFSLHMKSSKEIDGISVPLNKKMLKDKNLIKKLQTLTPEKIIKNLNFWAKNLK